MADTVTLNLAKLLFFLSFLSIGKARTEEIAPVSAILPHFSPREWEGHLRDQKYRHVLLDRPALLQDRDNLTFTIDVIYAGAQDGVSSVQNPSNSGRRSTFIVILIRVLFDFQHQDIVLLQ
jgi:hypothetical protein